MVDLKSYENLKVKFGTLQEGFRLTKKGSELTPEDRAVLQAIVDKDVADAIHEEERSRAARPGYTPTGVCTRREQEARLTLARANDRKLYLSLCFARIDRLGK